MPPTGNGDVARFDVWLISLDPKRGAETGRTELGVIVSPDEMNRHIRTVIVAPMASAGRTYPTRVRVRFEGRDGEVVLDQIRTVDKTRLIGKLGALPPATAKRVSAVLLEMFAWD